jgi:hypothetical protein
MDLRLKGLIHQRRSDAAHPHKQRIGVAGAAEHPVVVAL